MNKKILFALLLMGFSSLIIQTLILRESLISFYGNELTIGIMLANWIILEAFGSKISTKLSIRAKKPFLIYSLLQLLIAIYLPISIFLVRNIKNIFKISFMEGMPIEQIFISCFFIILPFAIFDGSQFPFGCRIYHEDSKKILESAGYVYILEAVGFILASPIFYILIRKFNSFHIVFLLGILNLISAILLLKDKLTDILDKIFFIFLILFIILYIGLFAITPKINQYSIKNQWKKQNVLSYKNSIYSNLVVTESNNQYTFYSNGIPIITTPMPDITYIEEIAHFPMLSSPSPKNILLIGGGAGGVIKEILKYPIENITYLELDPELIKQIENFPTDLTKEELSDKRVKIKYIDGRRYIKITKSKYDVVIVNLPIPSTLQLNRFYTKEFFNNIKSILKPNGILAFSLAGSLSYINEQLKNLNGSILNTLEELFFVNIIPGDFNIYIASKEKININPEIFLERLNKNNIETKLLTEFYLKYRLDPKWLNWFYKSIGNYKNIKQNLDLLPTATFYGISYWNAIFSPRAERLFKILNKIQFKVIIYFISILGLILFLSRLFINKSKASSIWFVIFTSGFIGLSFELIFIYMYQAFYGFVFSHIVFLTASFMLGLTLGGWSINRRLNKIKDELKKLSKIEMMIIFFCLIIIPILLYLKTQETSKISFIFFILQIICGFGVGSEFPLANKIYTKAGILYSLDLFGAFFSAILISIIFIPIIGVLNTCIILALIKIISFILLKINS